MRWLIGLICSTVGGAVGWWLGAQIAGGIMTPFLLGIIGSAVGVYAGVRWARENLP